VDSSKTLIHLQGHLSAFENKWSLLFLSLIESPGDLMKGVITDNLE